MGVNNFPEVRGETKFLVNFNQRDRLKNELVNYYIFFDTETEQAEEYRKIGQKYYKILNNKLKVGWACFWDRKENIEMWHEITDIKKFHKWISKRLSSTGNNTVWFVAHNIVFDAIITDLWSFLESKKYTSEFIHNKGMSFIQNLKNAALKNVYLVNSGNIYPAKLEKIGEAIGKPKLEVDFSKCSIDELSTYCRRDVDILVTFFREWLSFLDEHKLGKLKTTISGQSMEAFKKRFCNDYIVLNNLVENLQFERKAYYGGRTEIYVNGKYTDKVYYYDVNSIYAYVMKMYKYTTEYIFCRDNPTITKVKEYLNKGWLIIAECYLNIPLDTKIPPYPYKKDEVLTFPTGRIKTTLATPEVINAMEEGHLEGFGHVSFYHSANIFEEYIDFFYGKRLEYKANDDNRAMLMKHFLTHLYGKFGQKKDKWEKISEQDLKKIPGFEDFNLEAYILGEYKPPTIIVNYKNITPHIRYIAGELQISTSEGEGAQSFPAIAAHVTSYARMVLYKALKYCLDNNIRVFYCDTDSLFTDKELPGHMVDQAELGKLKLEHTFNFGIDFMGLKNYAELNDRGEKIVNIKDTINLDTDSIIPKDSKIIKGDSWKLKGISSTAEMIDETHFIQQEWSGISKQQYFVRYGRQPGEYWILYVSKQINPENKKGILNNNNEYEPLKIKDY